MRNKKIRLICHNLMNSDQFDEWRYSKIEFRSKNYFDDKSLASKFKGELTFYFDKWGIIYWNHYKFTEVVLDMYTTKRWIDKQTINFQRRKRLFESLSIPNQEFRPDKNSHKLFSLSPELLNKFNHYLNNEYDSSLKNIISLIKGSNPSGEVQSPKNAEMILMNNSENVNFTLFLSACTIYVDKNLSESIEEKKAIIQKTNNYLIKNSIFVEKYFYDQFYLYEKFKYLLINLNKKNGLSEKEYKKALKKIQNTMEDKTWEILKYNKLIEAKINNYKNKYFSNLQKLEEQKNTNFTFESIERVSEIERAHIYSVKWIKNKIDILIAKSHFKNIDLLMENNKVKELLENISDVDNYLSFENETHRFFDKNYFTYNQNGEIEIISKCEKDFISYLEAEKFKIYKRIKKDCLTPKRINYLKLRNEKLKFLNKK